MSRHYLSTDILYLMTLALGVRTMENDSNYLYCNDWFGTAGSYNSKTTVTFTGSTYEIIVSLTIIWELASENYQVDN